MEKIKLFCIPYGGASALIYSEMEKHINENIDIFPLELSGRGLRYKDKLNGDFWNVVDELLEIIIQNTVDNDYAILGHCMGSILAFEICKKIEKLNLKLPINIFFSGSRAPHDRKLGPLICDMSNEDIIEELLSIGRIDPVLASDNIKLNSFLPIWKSDCNMMDEYKCSLDEFKLKSDVTVLGGNEDKLVTFSDLQEWKKYCSYNFSIKMINGEHFFLNENREIFVNIINDCLKK